jgi:hypothetical protein
MQSHEPQKPNWRKSYQETLVAHRDQLKSERLRGEGRQIRTAAERVKPVRELSDSEIDALSRLEAERDIQTAINEWNQSQVEARRKARLGEAF